MSQSPGRDSRAPSSACWASPRVLRGSGRGRRGSRRCSRCSQGWSRVLGPGTWPPRLLIHLPPLTPFECGDVRFSRPTGTEGRGAGCGQGPCVMADSPGSHEDRQLKAGAPCPLRSRETRSVELSPKADRPRDVAAALTKCPGRCGPAPGSVSRFPPSGSRPHARRPPSAAALAACRDSLPKRREAGPDPRGPGSPGFPCHTKREGAIQGRLAAIRPFGCATPPSRKGRRAGKTVLVSGRGGEGLLVPVPTPTGMTLTDSQRSGPTPITSSRRPFRGPGQSSQSV